LINDDSIENAFLVKTDFEMADQDCLFGVYGAGGVNNLAINPFNYFPDYVRPWNY